MPCSPSTRRCSIGAAAAACGRAARRLWVNHEDADMSAADLASGKGHKDENFPVASILIARKFRPAIMAFYRFARTADDVADNPAAPPAAKLALLEDMRASLIGESEGSIEAVALRHALAERSLSNQHALDLLTAFPRTSPSSAMPTGANSSTIAATPRC